MPLIAEVMVSRWAFEALMVQQFVFNEYESRFYELEKKESDASYKASLYFPEIKAIVKECKTLLKLKNDSAMRAIGENLTVVRNEIQEELKLKSRTSIDFLMLNDLVPEKFNVPMADSIYSYCNDLTVVYNLSYNNFSAIKALLLSAISIYSWLKVKPICLQYLA